MSRELQHTGRAERQRAVAGGGDGVSCDVGSFSCAPSFCLSRQEGLNLLYKGFFSPRSGKEIFLSGCILSNFGLDFLSSFTVFYNFKKKITSLGFS